MTNNSGKILIIGNGGREHAIAKVLSRSHSVKSIFVSPGNGGTALDFKNVNLDLNYPFKKIVEYAKTENIEFAVIGPEAYLVKGIVDILEANNIPCFGSIKQGALIEGSKEFAKDIMNKATIPTAGFEKFSEYEPALDYIKNRKPPFVFKADGIAAGKGVIITDNMDDSINALQSYFVEHKFGAAGDLVLIEDFLTGSEASILGFTDGKNIKLLSPSQDHKRAYDNDKGLNTGGMGVYTPVKFLSEKHIQYVLDKIMYPAINQMADMGINYKGILYAGLMVDNDNIKVVEFNARFGDPETQCVLPLLETDLYEIMKACITGDLGDINIKVSDKAACTVVLASGGYPEAYKKGYAISGLDQVQDAEVYHAGTLLADNGEIKTSGGRVLGVTGIGSNLNQAIDFAYQGIKQISFTDCYYRTDIGKKGL